MWKLTAVTGPPAAGEFGGPDAPLRRYGREGISKLIA